MKAAVESTPDEIINLLMKFEEQTNFNCYNFMKLVTHSVQHFGPNLEVSNYDHPSIRALIEKASKALSVRRVETDSICSTLLTVLQMYVPLAKAEFVDGASCTREQSTNFKNRAKNSSSISEFTRFKLENSQQSVSSKADTYRMKIRRTETSEDAGEQSLLVWQPSITKDVDGNQECCISIDYLEGAPKWYGSVAEAHEAFDFSSVVRGKYSTAKELTTGRQSKNIKSLFLKEAPNQIFTELNFMESLQKPSIISPTQAKLKYPNESLNSMPKTQGNCRRIGKRTIYSLPNLLLSDALECLNSGSTSTHLEIIASVAIYIDIDIDSKSFHSVRNWILLTFIAHTWVVMNGNRTFSLKGADAECFGTRALSGKNGVSFVGILAKVEGAQLTIRSIGGNGGNGGARPRVFRGMYCKDPKFMVTDQVNFTGKGFQFARCCKQDAYFWYDGGPYGKGGQGGKGGQIRIYTTASNLTGQILAQTSPGSAGKDGTPIQGGYTREFPSKEELENEGVVKIGKRYFIICVYRNNYKTRNETYIQEGKTIPSKPTRRLEFSDLDIIPSWRYYKGLVEEETNILLRTLYPQWIQTVENETTIRALLAKKHQNTSRSRSL